MKKLYYPINIIGCLLLAADLVALGYLNYEKSQYSKPFMVLENIDFSKANEYSGKLNIGFKTETNTEALIVLGLQIPATEDFDAEFFIKDSTNRKNYFNSELWFGSECYYTGTNYKCQYFSGVPVGFHDFKLIIKKSSKIMNKPVTIIDNSHK